MRNGFAFVELMFVVIIISIFISFAYPSYQKYLIHTRRHDGQIALFDLAQQLENFYAKHHSYEAATIATGLNTDVKAQPFSENKWYRLTITSLTSSNFSLQAIPLGTQVKDTACLRLTLDSNGNKGSTSVSHTNLEQCWQ